VRQSVLEVPVIRVETPPAKFLAATPVPRVPEGTCWDTKANERVLCNEQLRADRDANADALATCNIDKASARKWAEVRKGPAH
jgi:hypothetical protein